MNIKQPAEALWRSLHLPTEALSHLHVADKPDPIVDSSFKIGTAAQTAIGLAGLAVAHFHELQSGVEQTVTVDARHAAIEFKSEAYYAIEGASGEPFPLFENLAGLYQTKDNSYVRIHTNFPHHKQGILDILRCEPTRESVAQALLHWNAVDFETAAASRKMVATALRSFDQSPTPPSGPHGSPPSGRPLALDGIRVLDLTRVLAGPVCGRTLAAHGADVLWVTSPKLPTLPNLDVDTSRGKRTTQLDLDAPADSQTLAALAADADVFLQAYRPGGLAGKGFGVGEVAQLRPGIVYASLTAYGWDGPWKDRRGFDSLVQTATGFNVAEGEAFAAHSGASAAPTPRALPMQALDHAAGYMLAFGIQAALCKTITEGGTWEVRVSLAAVGHWIRSLGRLEPQVAFGEGRPLPPRSMEDPEVAGLTTRVEEAQTVHNVGMERRAMRAVRHAAVLSATPVREGEAPFRLDAHAPEWLPRD